MYKMVSVGCPPLSWVVYPVKKSGQLMTRHSGLIHPTDGWICTRIEECRHIDLTINNY
ncbi:Uncharacterised protein [uncultured archaeon]|nr:Uncharacterised protein [uncultured archaeon]